MFIPNPSLAENIRCSRIFEGSYKGSKESTSKDTQRAIIQLCRKLGRCPERTQRN